MNKLRFIISIICSLYFSHALLITYAICLTIFNTFLGFLHYLFLSLAFIRELGYFLHHFYMRLIGKQWQVLIKCYYVHYSHYSRGSKRQLTLCLWMWELSEAIYAVRRSILRGTKAVVGSLRGLRVGSDELIVPPIWRSFSQTTPFTSLRGLSGRTLVPALVKPADSAQQDLSLAHQIYKKKQTHIETKYVFQHFI